MKHRSKIHKQTPLVEFSKEKLKNLILGFTPEKLASFLDVTDLKADTTYSKIEEMAELARKNGCASVCVNPVEVDVLPGLLKGSNVKECYVIDFPLGKMDIEMKAVLTAHTINKSRENRGEGKGKIELDMVINVGRLRTDPAYTLEEINSVCESADGEHVKVIVRSAELSEEDLVKVSEIVAKSKAHFIKNSTGMDAFGATPEHIRVMREVMGNTKGVKAAGGISDAQAAMQLIYAGAPEKFLQTPELFRLGTSKPWQIITSMSWLLKNSDQWINTAYIPCSICPFIFAEKLREDLREAFINRCLNCKFKKYRFNQ